MKAIALLSGGLDSTLAARLIIDQGIEVEALKFTSPFCRCDSGGVCHSDAVARELGIPIKTLVKGPDYLDVVRNPKHGYGSGVNPCIDCRIYILRRAAEYAHEAGASFIFTGEVLGQRPMSQHREALGIIEREAGLEGLLLRPLSAQFLPETIPEREGWVDRGRLLAITGRGRRELLDLASEFNITSFGCPGGGCLLTDKNFARRMRDFMVREKGLTLRDILILQAGRHFRIGPLKIIVGRNERENDVLSRNCGEMDILFEAPDVMGPVTLLQGNDDEAVALAAGLTAAYSDAPPGEVTVQYGHADGDRRTICIARPDKESFAHYLL